MDLSRTSDSDESFPGGSEISHESLGERKVRVLIWGPFLESPGNFTGPKSNIQIEI